MRAFFLTLLSASIAHADTTFTVNTELDDADRSGFDGICETYDGDCSSTNSLIANNTLLDAPIPDDCNGVLEVYGWNLLADDNGCTFSGNGIAVCGQVSPRPLGRLRTMVARR